MPEPRRLAAVALAALACCGAPTAAAEPALWSAHGDAATVWLFGSVHLLREGRFAIEGGLAEAWRGAKSVCFEVDMGALAPDEATRVTLARAIDPDGRTLFDLLGDDAARVVERATAAGIDLKPYAVFEPWFASLTLALSVLQQQGFEPDHGVEQIVQRAAVRDEKASCGLETVDQQLGYLDQLPPELQLEMLMESIDDAADLESEMERLLEAWQDGDDAALARLLDEDFDDYPELADLLIYRRNQNWVEQIERMLGGGDDALVVVGALHLVGDRGLPALLARRGYRVERR